MICPNCKEDNAPSFRFCGMCGTSLESRRKPGAPALDPLSAFPPPVPQPTAPPRVEQNVDPTASQPARTLAMAGATNSATKPVPPISGPSMLGLDRPDATQFAPNEPMRSWPAPSMDSLRDPSFAGLDSFLEPERAKNGPARILLLMVLLAGLVAAGWWTYTNYVGSALDRASDGKPTATVTAPTSQTALQSAPQAPLASPPQTPTTSAPIAEHPAESTNPAPEATVKPPDTTATATAKSANDEQKEPAAAVPPAAAPAPAKSTPVRDQGWKRPSAAKSARPVDLPPATSAADAGDSDFRKGEAYLYGRGLPENCDQAVRNLKAASAKSNAKARSTFGTMYATGHCVPRDLPTSYLWFAMALRVDPNNQILEKDLNAIWNQMTPPERQMATRMKE